MIFCNDPDCEGHDDEEFLRDETAGSPTSIRRGMMEKLPGA